MHRRLPRRHVVGKAVAEPRKGREFATRTPEAGVSDRECRPRRGGSRRSAQARWLRGRRRDGRTCAAICTTFLRMSTSRQRRLSTPGKRPGIGPAVDSVVVEELGLLLHDRRELPVLVTADVAVAEPVADFMIDQHLPVRMDPITVCR